MSLSVNSLNKTPRIDETHHAVITIENRQFRVYLLTETGKELYPEQKALLKLASQIQTTYNESFKDFDQEIQEHFTAGQETIVTQFDKQNHANLYTVEKNTFEKNRLDHETTYKTNDLFKKNATTHAQSFVDLGKALRGLSPKPAVQSLSSSDEDSESEFNSGSTFSVSSSSPPLPNHTSTSSSPSEENSETDHPSKIRLEPVIHRKRRLSLDGESNEFRGWGDF